ncbi:MAG: hypothetical protein PHI70_03180 [Proteiniphilum sp.]|nr:hypothetical protein [Proteiniphilum sp.]MDD3908386.1 hypothetical protein [Proteiniphilum sp.]MDD4415775.1 hypothetical protein [Proteiniphilum sp.]
MSQIINKTPFGIVFKCSKCGKIHIEFNNINFNFSLEEFREFSSYLNQLDGEYWEAKNKDSLFQRKIRIPIGKTLCLLLTSKELSALRNLLKCSPRPVVERDLITRFFQKQCYN